MVEPKDLQKMDNLLYILDDDRLRLINITSDELISIFQFQYDPLKFFVDDTTSLSYVIHPTNQIDVLDLVTSTITKWIGTTSSESNQEAVGTFNETRFDKPRDMTKLGDDLLLVSDYSGNRSANSQHSNTQLNKCQLQES